MLAVSSPMDIGDYPAGNIGQVSVFTNAEEVRLYKNGAFVSVLEKGDYSALPHGPMVLTDTIGDLLVTQEGFDRQKAELLKKALNSAARYGLAGMPKSDMLRMAYAMLRYKMSFKDGVALYGKYVGNWGGEATVWRFDAVTKGEVVASVTCCPSAKLQLEVTATHTHLREFHTYDMAAVRIRVLDEFGNVAPYAQIPIRFETDGHSAELVGPDVVTAEGGMTGTYLRSTGKKGTTRLTISSHGLESITLDFTV